MPSSVRVAKDPDDADDFTWDWATRLGVGETISTKEITFVSGGGSVVSSVIAGTKVTARLAGGTSGTLMRAQCRIVTSTGRQLDWTLDIPVLVQ